MLESVDARVLAYVLDVVTATLTRWKEKLQQRGRGQVMDKIVFADGRRLGHMLVFEYIKIDSSWNTPTPATGSEDNVQ